jgi:hypothetical protein
MTITTDRLIEIENERQKTMSDPNFQKWMKKMKVSSTYRDRDPIHKAQDMMRDYNFNKLFVKQNFFSIFNI